MTLPSDRTTVEVLGPLRVRDSSGQDLTPNGSLQRRLLSLLVLRRGTVTTPDSAIDALWPTGRPTDALAALHNHLSRLRHGLPPGLIESVATGYRLDPRRVDVDADRLADLVSAGPPDPAAMSELSRVLRRWAGPAHPELDDTDAGRAEAAHYEELRVRAIEGLAAARLDRDETEGLIEDLSRLVDAEPLRERPRALLMSALAADGRTSEALRVYDDLRRRLGEELGISPSPDLAAHNDALLTGTEPAPLARPTRRLPRPATSLVARQGLVRDLVIRADSGRLVTLVGPGGVGKTRLLLEVGHELHLRQPDRPVVFCDLTPTDPATAVDAVASELGMDPRPGMATDRRLVEMLGTDPLVLLVDNCEHVLEPVAKLVDAVIQGCSEVTVLATSRERLRLPGEEVCSVPTLLTDGDEAAASELFVQRARSVRPDFDPDDHDRTCIARIVQHLDGLPLAIELAAARLHTHDLTEIAAGIDQPLQLLSAGYRTSYRHSSLAALTAWSYGLLEPDVQEMFTALAIFGGPFSVDDAAAVCDASPDEVAGSLAQLVERSLLTRAPGGRFTLLETLRSFAFDRLSASGRHEDVATRHADWMVTWAEDAARRLPHPGPSVLAEVDGALGELRAGLVWLLDHDRTDQAGRLVTALVNYGLFRLRPDVLAWSHQVIEKDPDGAVAWASPVWAAAAYSSWMTGDLTEADRYSRRSIEIIQQSRAELTQVAATMRGNIDLFAGRLGPAAEWYRRAGSVATDEGQRLIAVGTELLALGYAGDDAAKTLADSALAEVGEATTPTAAYVWYCAGEATLGFDVALARPRLSRAIEIASATDGTIVVGLAGSTNASIEARDGDPAAAASEYRWLLPHWLRAGMWSAQWTTLRSIVGLLERLDRHREAAVLEGAVRATTAGHRIFGADDQALKASGHRLRVRLGDGPYEEALREGAALDGQAAVEHVLSSL